MHRHRGETEHGHWQEAMIRSLDLTYKNNGEPSNLCGGSIIRCNVEAGDPREAVAVIWS